MLLIISVLFVSVSVSESFCSLILVLCFPRLQSFDWHSFVDFSHFLNILEKVLSLSYSPHSHALGLSLFIYAESYFVVGKPSLTLQSWAYELQHPSNFCSLDWLEVREMVPYRLPYPSSDSFNTFVKLLHWLSVNLYSDLIWFW